MVYDYAEVIIVNRKRFTTALIAMMMVSVIGLGAVACKKTEPTETSIETSELTTTTTTTVPTTTLTEYTGPLTNDVEVSWTETPIEEKTLYANVTKGEFLNVRKGPATTYEKVGTLTRGQAIKVVATSGGWYKTVDGFYVSENYLVATPPN